MLPPSIEIKPEIEICPVVWLLATRTFFIEKRYNNLRMYLFFSLPSDFLRKFVLPDCSIIFPSSCPRSPFGLIVLAVNVRPSLRVVRTRKGGTVKKCVRCSHTPHLRTFSTDKVIDELDTFSVTEVQSEQ